ncbi:MAG TPA: DUF4172 domain-containing protein [Terricaulis sp.]|nr:DUF4172 domain-containing protein [Terricaulis sp.]
MSRWPQSWHKCVSGRQCRRIGRMQALGANLRAEAELATLTECVLKSSEIEGDVLRRLRLVSRLASIRRLGD